MVTPKSIEGELTLVPMAYDSCCIVVMGTVGSGPLLYAAEVASNYWSGIWCGAVGAHNCPIHAEEKVVVSEVRSWCASVSAEGMLSNAA